MTIEIRNAVIESARIHNDDHGLLTVWVGLDYGGSGQGFGGYSLYLPKGFKHHNPSGPNYAGHFIWRVMEVAGVSEWSQLPGKTIRAKCDWTKVIATGAWKDRKSADRYEHVVVSEEARKAELLPTPARRKG